MKILSAYPAVKLSVTLCSGVLTGYFLPHNRAHLCLLVIAFTLFALAGVRHSRNTIISYIIIFLSGMLLICEHLYNIPEMSLYKKASGKSDKYVTLIGNINDIPDFDSTRVRFTMNVHFILSHDTIRCKGKVTTTIYKAKYDTSAPSLFPGDKVSVKGRLSEPAGQRNEGEFDYRRYLYLKDIHFTFRAYGYASLVKNGTEEDALLMNLVVYPAKAYCIKTIESNVPGDEGQYLKGLVAGDRSDISDETRTAFTDAGVSHLIAVSGLNVAYIVISLTLVLSVFRINKNISIFLIIIFLIFYCLLTGNSASIQRASIMGALALCGVRMQRKNLFYNIAGISAAVILIADSRLMFDAGFLLSYSATLSMVWIYQKIEKHFLSSTKVARKKTSKWIFLLTASFSTTLAAQLGTLPLTALYFGKISLISLPLNIIAVPMANLSLAIGFLQISLSLFSETISSLAAESNFILLHMQLALIKYSASLPGAYIFVRTPAVHEIISVYIILAILFGIQKRSDFPARACISILLSIAVLTFPVKEDAQLRIDVIDVGQGDCIVIRTFSGKCIVIDSGNSINGYDSGEKIVAPFLRRMGIDEIDLLMLTHNHADHIGGSIFLVDNLPIRKILCSSAGMAEGLASDLYHDARQRGIPVIHPGTGDYFEFDGLKIYFIFPAKENRGQEVTNLNNSSLVALIKYKEAEFLFTGDIEAEAESSIIRQYGNFIKADVLKAAHHGSITSSASFFLASAMPDAAVISCGKFNKFGHPSAEVLGRLSYFTPQILRTDTGGGVIITTDGHHINISSSYHH